MNGGQDLYSKEDSSPGGTSSPEDNQDGPHPNTGNVVGDLSKLPDSLLYFIDKKGGETCEQPPLYTAHYEGHLNDQVDPVPREESLQPGMECFNCGESHHVAECTHALDGARISRKRRQMARNMPAKKIRYFEHELNNQRFQPGKLSNELRNALNLHPQELPPFIYRMRVLGYPPGWLADAEIETSGIRIYGLDRDSLDDANIEDGEIDSTEIRVQYDPQRLISFPGFNVPVPPGVLDMHETYNMPPMLPHQQRSEAEKYMKAPEAKALGQRLKLPSTAPKPSSDTGPVVDMEMGDGTEEDPAFIPVNGLKSSELDQSGYSQSPRDTEDSDNLVTSSEGDYATYTSESTTTEQSSEASDPTVVMPASETKSPEMRPPETRPPETRPPETRPPETRPPETRPPETRPPETRPPETRPPETRPPETRPPETEPPETRLPETRLPETRPPETRPPETRPPETRPPETRPPETRPPETRPPETRPPETGPPETIPPETIPPEIKPREVTMGTPFVMGFSGFTRLPPRENFAKDVSPYIPFENLPGATGTYDRLRVVLDKVRVALQENKDKTKDGEGLT